MSFSVLVTQPDFLAVCASAAARLEAAGASIHATTLHRPYSRTELLALVPTVDAVIAATDEWSADIMAAAPHLEIIARFGVGLDNVDLAAATERGIWVTNTPGANASGAAELAIGLMLAVLRDIPLVSTGTKAGSWYRPVGHELGSRTLGILGLGAIGGRVATIATAFGAEVIAFDPIADEAQAARVGARLATFDEVVSSCDVLSLHLPATPETHHLINEQTLAAMKPGAVLINCARGTLVDAVALRAAVDSGHLLGAGIDVFETEPPEADNVLLSSPRIVVTPHLAGVTRESYARIGEVNVDAIVAVRNGQRPANVVAGPGEH